MKEDVKMKQNLYTGREIAIFTDCHALLEPTRSALEDIAKRKITEIYSLGDNIGVGPNPSEVLDLLMEYGVYCLAGNSEYYSSLGIEPFESYFTSLKTKSQLWTLSKLNEQQLGEIKLFPHSIELLVGGKKLALCHFANDVRSDFLAHSTYSYQRSMSRYGTGYKQFLYTNSKEQERDINRAISIYAENSSKMAGYVATKRDPLFSGKRIDFFDAVIQGHVHFKIYEESDSTKFWSVRAVGMAYEKDPIDTASYVILKEKINNLGFDLEEVLVRFDREKMEYNILRSDIPDRTIEKFTCIKR